MCEFNCYICQEIVGQWQGSLRHNVADRSKMYLDLQMKFPILLPDFNTLRTGDGDFRF